MMKHGMQDGRHGATPLGTARGKPFFSPDLLAQLLDRIGPGEGETWDVEAWRLKAFGAFRFLTEDKTHEACESKWFEIVRKVAPGKRPFELTVDDWKNVIGELHN